MDNTIKEQIIEFLQQENPSPDTAAELIQKHGNNQSEVRVFITSPSRYLMQMRWALAKLCGISLGDFQKGIIGEIRKQTTEDLPDVIKRIKEELPILYNQRAATQKELVELGEANDDATKEKAKTLGEIAEMLGIRHQLLQEAKEAYFDSKGEYIPNEEELFPEETQNTEETNTSVKYDWEGDPVKAMATKKNREASLSKDRNLLLYQSKTKQTKENPMPEGTDRDKIEARIAEKETELAAIAEYLKQ